jgi:hypothetical protein
MRLIILNRKRLGVTVIIVGLMLVLFGLEKKFDGRLKYVALMQSNINSLVKYEAPELNFSYKLPDMWTAKKKDFGGGEIVYHNDFSSEDATIHGFVQVWNIKQDLKSFLDKSKEVNQQYAQYSDYNVSPIVINKHEGYLMTYNMQTSPEGKYKGYEYFLKDTNKFFRFSFFVRDINFKENMPTIFKTIVDTFEHKD